MKINKSGRRLNLLALIACVIVSLIVYAVAGPVGFAVVTGTATSLYAAWLGAGRRSGHHDK